VLGDTRHEPFAAIWRGQRYAAMRAQFRRDWEQIEICSRCTYAYEGGNYTDIVADTWLFPENAPSARPDRER
jgi:hypothetical protein